MILIQPKTVKLFQTPFDGLELKSSGGGQVNHVSLIGRLAGDPCLRYTAKGTAVTGFVLAVERLLQPDDQADRAVEFIKVVTFGKVGEACSGHLYKGRRVAVEGSLRTARWQGEDGRVRQRVEVVARLVEFLDGKRKNDQGNEENEAAG
ncbi:MAG: single-stranded DNA-binding protein [Clostridia bacterium]|nr:MAG: single-stranded DNA-binding protein [Clostridia bacterium]